MVRFTEPDFLKARREHRGLTRAAPGDAAGATTAVMTQLGRGLSEKWRLWLAPVPDVRPDLMTSDPSKG